MNVLQKLLRKPWDGRTDFEEWYQVYAVTAEANAAARWIEFQGLIPPRFMGIARSAYNTAAHDWNSFNASERRAEGNDADEYKWHTMLEELRRSTSSTPSDPDSLLQKLLTFKCDDTSVTEVYCTFMSLYDAYMRACRGINRDFRPQTDRKLQLALCSAMPNSRLLWTRSFSNFAEVREEAIHMRETVAANRTSDDLANARRATLAADKSNNGSARPKPTAFVHPTRHLMVAQPRRKPCCPYCSAAHFGMNCTNRAMCDMCSQDHPTESCPMTQKCSSCGSTRHKTKDCKHCIHCDSYGSHRSTECRRKERNHAGADTYRRDAPRRGRDTGLVGTKPYQRCRACGMRGHRSSGYMGCPKHLPRQEWEARARPRRANPGTIAPASVVAAPLTDAQLWRISQMAVAQQSPRPASKYRPGLTSATHARPVHDLEPVHDGYSPEPRPASHAHYPQSAPPAHPRERTGHRDSHARAHERAKRQLEEREESARQRRRTQHRR